MRNFLWILVIVQLSIVAVSVAQITFTREWVTGKRSGPPKVKILMHDEEASFCRSLIPAIDYLLEMEKVRQKVCGPLTKPPMSFFKKPLQGNDIQQFEDSTFDRNLPDMQKSA